MTKKPTHLMQNSTRYRTSTYPDRVCYIQTLREGEEGMTYDVYDFSDTRLAACLPPRSAKSLLKRFPRVFKVHQNGEDAMVLLFPEDRLKSLADLFGDCGHTKKQYIL